MKILCIDTFGESVLDWLLRCKADGHIVRWFIAERKTPIGRGMGIEIVPDWRPHMLWADLVFLPDNLRYLKELDAWRARGAKIVSPTVETAAWETDRTLGMKVLEKHGIECPAYREFNNYDAAIAYVRKEDRPFVSKPCGNETDKALSYVAKSPEDLIWKLEQWKRQSKLKGTFILQEKVEGIECGVGRWFGPGGFNAGYEHNVEFKKLMPGDCGPNTGEMGSFLQVSRKSKLGRMVLDPLGDTLERLGYVGCIDVNCIVTPEGKPYPLEFTMRPGWPAFNIQQAIQRGDHAEWLLDLIEGRDARCFVYDTAAIGVVLALPPFPYPGEKKDEVVGVPIYGITDKLADAVHPCQMMMGTGPQKRGGKIVTAPMHVSAGTYVMVVTGTGETVSQAARAAYAALKKINVPSGSLHRDDIGRKLAKQLPALHALGFMEGCNY